MVDWLLELRGAETGAAAGQNDKKQREQRSCFIFARHSICRICKL